MATEKREKFCTDLKAHGVVGHCPLCQWEAEVLVCWCQKVEGCRVCLAEHMVICRASRGVRMVT